MDRLWCKTDSPAYLDGLRARMEQKTNRSGKCWLWTGSTVAGYGQIKVKNRNTLAHRVALELSGVTIPDGMDALHSCDNPGCVNPAHLFLGSHSENMADKAKKGRGTAKLKAAQVARIKAQLEAGTSCNSIAVKLRLSPHTIRDIRDGVTWRHVTSKCP